MEMKEPLLHATPWMNFTRKGLCYRSQTRKDSILYDLIYTKFKVRQRSVLGMMVGLSFGNQREGF